MATVARGEVRKVNGKESTSSRLHLTPFDIGDRRIAGSRFNFTRVNVEIRVATKQFTQICV